MIVTLKVLYVNNACSVAIIIWVDRLATAAPRTLNRGINMIFSITLNTTPKREIMLRCLKLPLAVSRDPNMYVIEMKTNETIRIARISDDSSGWCIYSKFIISLRYAMQANEHVSAITSKRLKANFRSGSTDSLDLSILEKIGSKRVANKNGIILAASRSLKDCAYMPDWILPSGSILSSITVSIL